MDIDHAAAVLVALRCCSFEEASDELLDASKRHRVPPLAVARALVALAGGVTDDNGPASAARYEWGSLLEPEVIAS